MYVVLNWMVILNSVSWYFLDLIFYKYLDNLMEKIFIECFKDLLKDLNFGEIVLVIEILYE